MSISAERLRDLMSYDAETGLFTWKVRRGKAHPGSEAGYIKEANQYAYITVDRKKYLYHRLVWLYVHGSDAEMDIDHINGIRHDNRIANLRQATRSQQGMNRGPNAGRTTKGVTWHKQIKKWQAQIAREGVYHYLGVYDDKELAAAAYNKAAVVLFGEFRRQS